MKLTEAGVSIGPAVPRRGNNLTGAVGRFGLRVLGWRMVGAIPDQPKMIAIGAPHTSNWDFLVAMLAMFALGIRLSWMGKHTLFTGPTGSLMRWLGGLAIDRRAPQGSVAQVVDAFERADRLIVGITPEGTRTAVAAWKTGFYRIAHAAEVPILPIALDWGRKQLLFGDLIWPKGEMEAEIEAIKAQFRPIKGRYPHAF